MTDLIIIIDSNGKKIGGVHYNRSFQPITIKRFPLEAFVYTNLPVWLNDKFNIEGYLFKQMDNYSTCDVYLCITNAEGYYKSHVGYAQLEDVEKFFGVD